MVGLHTGLRDCTACPSAQVAHRAAGLCRLPSPAGCTQSCGTVPPPLARGVHTELQDCAACPRPRGAHRAAGLCRLPSPAGCTQSCGTVLPALAHGVHTELRDSAACPRPRGAHRAAARCCLPLPMGCTQSFGTPLPALARGVHTELRHGAACPCPRGAHRAVGLHRMDRIRPSVKTHRTGGNSEPKLGPSEPAPVWRPCWILLELGLIGTRRVVNRHPSRTPHEAAMAGEAQKLTEEQALRRGRD
ncbi:PREDICTED: uncharacterized protein LOC105572329 [Cercocebus atys]|uniref:uncharacterized protein LOC105572329 n=1 Tax=Cercocebus atys TaxID=9531 RepID=UPI0005F48669|nr:PREDICTED: uncharacterized protein LOC105572329 [Cercocebus atys]